MSCGQIALERVGIKVDKYFASEIDKYAIQITQKNYPNTIQLGDILQLDEEKLSKLPKIDLLIGGSPCQDFSSLKFNRQDLQGEKSRLFYEYLKILRYIQKNNNKDVKFLLENVRMKKDSKENLDNFLGVEGKYINSNLLSSQNRPRFYWSNIEFDVDNLKESELTIDSIILDAKEVEEKHFCKPHQIAHYEQCKYIVDKTDSLEVIDFYNKNIKYGKANCVTPHAARCDKSATNITKQNGRLRRFTPIECERLQTVPDNYTYGVSDGQRYKMLGNGWTVEVITHIFKNIAIEMNKAE